MKLASIILAGLLMTSINGQVWGPDTRLTHDPALSRYPSIAVFGKNIHVVWQDQRDENWKIYYKRSTNNGLTWGGDIKLTSGGYPSIAISGENIHVVWTAGFEIYYKHSTDNGQTWGDDTRLTQESHESWSPSIAISGENIHVVWPDDRDGNEEIYYKRSTDNGQTWGKDTRLTQESHESWSPSIAVSGDNIHIIWYDRRDGSVYYKRSLNNGETWTADQRLPDTSHSSWTSSIAVSENNIHVVWQDKFDVWEGKIYYKRSTNNGETWGEDVRLTNETNRSVYPSVAVSGNNIHIVWQDYRDSDREIYYKCSTDNGETWGIDTRLTYEKKDSEFPSIMVSENNIIHIVWQDARDRNWEIYYKHAGEARQPDNQIKNSDEEIYTGDNIYNPDGTDQTKEQIVSPGTPAVYHIKMENDGLMIDNIRVKGTGDKSDWIVRYYDTLIGGTDITLDVTGLGWLTGTLSSGDEKEIRVEVTPDSSTPEGSSYEILITSSSMDGLKKDAVKAITTVQVSYQPDNQIKNSNDAFYIGDNIYNLDGTNQTGEQIVSSGVFAVYHIKIENDGDASDQIVVKGTPSSQGWDVKYYDALTGGTEITEDIIGSGWSTGELSIGEFKEVRVEITPSSAPDGSSYGVLITSTSYNDTTKKDVVKAITMVKTGIEEEMAQIPKDYFLYAFPNPSDNMAIIRYSLPKENEVSLIVYDIKGSIVRTLTRTQSQEPGVYTVVWDGCDEKGMQLPNGVYFYQLKTRDFSITKKMTLLR